MRDAYLEDEQKKLLKECEPTPLEVRRQDEALTYLLDFENFGLPYEGGSLDQPYNWKRAVSFAMRVRGDADWERKKVAAEEARIEAENY